jgi:predicted  nucleic acid-binding Zn-ribbon protein
MATATYKALKKAVEELDRAIAKTKYEIDDTGDDPASIARKPAARQELTALEAAQKTAKMKVAAVESQLAAAIDARDDAENDYLAVKTETKRRAAAILHDVKNRVDKELAEIRPLLEGAYQKREEAKEIIQTLKGANYYPPADQPVAIVLIAKKTIADGVARMLTPQ